jgi:5-methylcytosine-specific restriction protein A
MPKLSCLDCGIPTARSRCDICFAKRQAFNPRVRAKTATRGYNSEWNRVRLTILDRDRWSCTYCGKHLEGADATVDHIVALANGGDRTDPSNLTSSCRSCNSRKKDQ